jgi:hypothetical protein
MTPTVKGGSQETQARIRDKIRDIREFFKPTILLRAVRGLHGLPAEYSHWAIQNTHLAIRPKRGIRRI